MSKRLFICLALLDSAMAFAAPQARDVVLRQDQSSHKVTLSYVLDEPAVVTFDIQTNGVSVGAAALANATGDFGRLLAAGPHAILWKPNRALPGVTVAGPVRGVVRAWSKDSPPDYLVVDTVAPSNCMYYASAAEVPGGVTNDLYKTDKIVFRKVYAAGRSFRMGQNLGVNQVDVELLQTPRYVAFTNDYYLGIYELTQAQYDNFVGAKNNYSKFRGCPDSPRRPTDFGSWHNYRHRDSLWPEHGYELSGNGGLTYLRRRTGLLADLPTEAQWEFACRAGVDTVLYTGEDLVSAERVNRIAWSSANWSDDPVSVACGNSNQTHAVGQLLPNAWGFYDMLGNVRELCLDILTNDAADPEADWGAGRQLVDPQGPTGATASSRRAVRGGSYLQSWELRQRPYQRESTSVSGQYANTGLRVWLPASAPDWMLNGK